MLDLQIINVNYKVDEVVKSVDDDTWDLLSFVEYADEQYMPHYIYANKYLDISLTIEGGLDINIPKINIVKPTSLPPWKRSK